MKVFHFFFLFFLLTFFYLVHRGVAPESEDEKRFILFWLSYDRDVLTSNLVNVDYDQITPVAAGSKFIQSNNEVYSLHQMMYVRKRLVMFSLFSLSISHSFHLDFGITTQ